MLPSWGAELGKAVINGAAVMRKAVFEDARTVFLEDRHPSGETHAMGVLIDDNLDRNDHGRPTRRIDRRC